MNRAIFDSIVEAFNNAMDKDGASLRMDGLIVSDDATEFVHHFHDSGGQNDIRSLSKTVVVMALGRAIAEGFSLRGEKVTLDTPIWPFFENKIPLSNTHNEKRLRAVTLKHALTHTMGFGVGLMFSKDVKERNPDTLLEYIFNSDLRFDPGQHFVYSNAGPYIFSALIQDELGLSLGDWVRNLIFTPLEIKDFDWKRYGPYCAGSSGLVLSLSDVHKLARLFVTGGEYNGKTVVPADWLKLMSTPAVNTPSMFDEKRVFPKYAYGLGLWICQDGRFYVDGTDGQYLIVLPQSRIVITTFGHQSDMKPITECLRPLLALKN